VVLLVLSPLLGLIAAAIAISSGRPVFYRGARVGKAGHLFWMYKFRTLAPDAETRLGPYYGEELTRRTEEERTRIGGALRKTHLDEVPQLWNVLRGDMSIVGPRPERPHFVEQFRHRIPSYMLRHKVKAGLTGWAQVNGWRGNTSIEKRIEYDLYYIENWSVRLDLKIMWLTLIKGFFHKHAY
jgi:lipopolysaccharide/colanic/teichoic acid biosynthesis glycosyltransferase